jgi:hypothetical protein
MSNHSKTQRRRNAATPEQSEKNNREKEILPRLNERKPIQHPKKRAEKLERPSQPAEKSNNAKFVWWAEQSGGATHV